MSGILRTPLPLVQGMRFLGSRHSYCFAWLDAILSPIEFMAASIAVGVIAAAIGGWVTAATADHHRQEHAAVLGILIASGALVSLVLHPGAGAIWTEIAAVVLMAPAALAGSWPWWSKSVSSRRK